MAVVRCVKLTDPTLPRVPSQASFHRTLPGKFKKSTRCRRLRSFSSSSLHLVHHRRWQLAAVSEDAPPSRKPADFPGESLSNRKPPNQEEEEENEEVKPQSETVVGAEGVPQSIIDAERASHPLRPWRLAVYCLASCFAAAQATYIWLVPESVGEVNVGSRLVFDGLVASVGAGLWRAELTKRAQALQYIWKEAEFRARSLERAEKGMGDTLWTARVRMNNNPLSSKMSNEELSKSSHED